MVFMVFPCFAPGFYAAFPLSAPNPRPHGGPAVPQVFSIHVDEEPGLGEPFGFSFFEALGSKPKVFDGFSWLLMVFVLFSYIA